MSRLRPVKATVEGLFRNSKNLCTFPGCKTVLVEEDDLFVGQIAHINAASRGGPRFDCNQTNEQRRSQGNLMLLCYPHHRRIDQLADRYTASQLLEMKRRHEEQAREPYSPPSPVLSMLTRKLATYWARLDYISQQRQERLEVAVPIDTSLAPVDLGSSTVQLISEIREYFPSLLDEGEIGDHIIKVSNDLQRAEIKARQLDLLLLHSLSVLGEAGAESEREIRRRQANLQQIIKTEVIND